MSMDDENPAPKRVKPIRMSGEIKKAWIAERGLRSNSSDKEE